MLEVGEARSGDTSLSRSKSQGNWSWLKRGYFLKWNPETAPGRNDGNVVLAVFNAPFQLHVDFERLLRRPNWEETLNDPFNLLVLVLQNFHKEVG